MDRDFAVKQSVQKWADTQVLHLLYLLEEGKVSSEDFTKKRHEIEDQAERMISNVKA
jgi:hypothetical protein